MSKTNTKNEILLKLSVDCLLPSTNRRQYFCRAPDTSVPSIQDPSFYPSSATTFSPGRSSPFMRSRKFVRSGNEPQGKGPYVQAICPVVMHTAASYRRPGHLNSCEYHLASNSVGSYIQKSVPYTDASQTLPKLRPKRLCHFIYNSRSTQTKANSHSAKAWNGYCYASLRRNKFPL